MIPELMIIPPRLKLGDTIGIVAPAGPVRPERLHAGISCLGDAFRLRIAESVTSLHPPGVPSYLAASDQARADELMAMLADREVRAVVLARGGYGIMRILPLLDPAVLRADPKPIVGFSDATALLSWAYHAGVRGIHGPVIAQLSDLPLDDVAHLITMLTVAKPLGARPWKLATRGRRVVRGPLVAGNLSLIASLVGTPWSLPLAGVIALLEEVGERPYEIDRYLTQLSLAGAFTSTAAVVVGELVRCVDAKPPTGVPDPDDAALATIKDRMAAASIPVAVGAPIGHGIRNEAVPFGAMCELDFERGVLSITEAAVS